MLAPGVRLLLALGAVAAALAGGLLLLARDRPVAPAASIAIAEALGGDPAAGFAQALAPRAFAFPADHGPHPGFRTEWWYYTGNLTTREGRPVGYQLTFFRNGLAPATLPRSSAWATTDVYMAHFAVTDAAGGSFHPVARFARGAAGLAGAQVAPFRVWLEDWSAAAADGTFPVRVRAASGDVAIDLVLDEGKPVVLQGDRGLSRKGPEPGNASYYYSLTRMPTRGTVRIGGETLAVEGRSWMDREWSTSALGDKIGWDWFALQLADGRDLMVYRLRRADGSTDAFSAGRIVAVDGSSRPLGAGDVTITVLDGWTSPRGGARYPARWRLEVPSERLVLEVQPLVADQEHREPIRYWEGAVRVTSTDGAAGVGYVELVGYADRASRARP
jgi:predicted secreted hydrolase